MQSLTSEILYECTVNKDDEEHSIFFSKLFLLSGVRWEWEVHLWRTFATLFFPLSIQM